MYKGKQNQSSKASLIPQFTEGNLQQYVQILYTHQKQCEKTGKYLQADMAKKKLVQMKVQLEKQRKSDIFVKHQQQKRQVAAAHHEELCQFNKFWDDKMIEYQSQAQKIQQQTLKRHDQQMAEYHQQIQNSLGYKQKQTSQLINLKRIQQNLAKQQNYVEAHRVQKQVQQLQRVQYEKWNINRTNKIKNLLMQLRTKQQNQLSAIRQRIEQGFEQQKKIRCQQQEKIIQKYINFVKQLENHHHQQVTKLQKSFKNQSALNFSRQSLNNSQMSRISQK